MCPPQPREQDGIRGAGSFDSAVLDEEGKDAAPVEPSSVQRWRDSVSAWLDKWVYATHSLQHRPNDNPAYKRPIPFDHMVFAWLDRHLVFEDDAHDLKPLVDGSAIRAETAIRRVSEHSLVQPHAPLAPWEDIPPIDRMRSFADQPGYTDGYDDFLWLPRDPLSTLDLDDTVEVRLSLTTSQGGDGRFGEWPPEEPGELYEELAEPADVSGLPPSLHTTGESPQTVERHISEDQHGTPTGDSGRHLFATPDSQLAIGSEVEDANVGEVVRRTSLRAVANLARVFGRERVTSGTFHTSLHSLSDIGSDSEVEEEAAVGAQRRPSTPQPAPASGKQEQSPSLSRMITPPSVITGQPGPVTTPLAPSMVDQSSSHVRADTAFAKTAPLPSTATLSSHQTGTYPHPRARARSRGDSRASSSRLSVGLPSTMPRSPSGGTTLKQRIREVSRMSGVQRAMLEEIVAEERKARKGDRKVEHAIEAREAQEIVRERAASTTVEPPLARERSRRSSNAVSPDPARRPSASRRFSRASTTTPGTPAPVAGPEPITTSAPMESPASLERTGVTEIMTPQQLPAKSAPKTEQGGTSGTTGRTGLSGDVSSMILQ